MPTALFWLTEPSVLSPTPLCTSLPKGCSFLYTVTGISQLRVVLGKLCPPSPRRGKSGTYLQRGSHGFATLDSCTDTQAPWDADGIGCHREALHHHRVPLVTTILPGKATNLQHQGTGGVRALPCVCRRFIQSCTTDPCQTSAHKEPENNLQPLQMPVLELPAVQD